MVRVTIKYLLFDDTNWREMEMPVEAYFVEDSEPFVLDSVPMHDHAVGYLSDTEKARVKATEVVIRDDAGESITIKETFWNGQRNRVIERIDVGSSPYTEIILDIQTRDDPVEQEVIEMVRERDMLIPIYHGVFTRHSDGSETERKISL